METVLAEVARGLRLEVEADAAAIAARAEATEPPARTTLTPFHERLLAEELLARSGDTQQRLAGALSEAKVDLNPHQVEGAMFALDSLSRGGCMLGDEVGLGKTIEAGLVIAQLMAEGKTRILILAPATLRAQWNSELREKFDLDSVLVDGRTVRATGNCFDQPFPVICSHPFAANKAHLTSEIAWDLVVIDEAHRLRNAHRANNKMGQALKASLGGKPKLLLTATPLQNDLMELFGLMSLLDEQILGPEHAFRSRYRVDEGGGMSEAAAGELKERLAPVVQRTLRRQVREYVRYTNRRSIVEDFTPSPEEHDLYEKVSEYLQRSEAAAIEPGKKTLLTLCYRKLLASSTYAIAPTLRRLSDNLEKRLAAAKLGQQALAMFEPEEAKQFVEEGEEWSDDPAKAPNVRALEQEVWELRQYADLADSIKVNAKGEALKRGLDRTFTVMRAHGWPEKALIFTESKRTQQYLFNLLSEHGYRGKISLLSGDAGTPEDRRALVDDFRNKTQILICTEAGAEGLNLQFCNLVVNYDLPWNPQRVEQRIGRCHRYGQQRDVLVINFLNRMNAADARLFELLEKKLNLFDGVFGASDEILGALESGVDFERRVLDIYQGCRKVEDINAAFDKLRSEMEGRISQRMTEMRSVVLERFDGDVRRRLRGQGEQTKEALAKRQQEARALTSSVLGSRTSGRLEIAKAAYAVKERKQDAVSYLQLDAAGLPSRLARLAGSEGWWFAYKFETTGLKPEEKLVHLVLVKDREGNFRALPLQDGAHFVKLAAKEEKRRQPAPVSVQLMQEQSLVTAKDEIVRAAERRNALELDKAKERADRYVEDCLMESREGVEAARQQWIDARKQVASVEDIAERAKARANSDRMEREYRRKLSSLRNEEEKRYAAKDRQLAELANKAKVNEKRSLIASAYFWLS
ncbi:DEAD/DEAH box helicase family protein [Myxococcus sp. CA051A]|uniref:ATP-dependent helicase n=1 Tax=Myxococcus llanfairpwllgwyngyllgogerychwyrndrobwllllantysiliogogogochensis TaxID=2590453 RepID=A0A540X1D1_9BACT|nr:MULTISPECIES: SNF2-related protein [Myxococcus]NTX01558.1 DEAD/DEAH box helicase family protein [Myxococcus sp. CA040A]NTX16198.1 DEAD/DEAH box helicase family protein [Myxococcus sp. CA056]NTX40113.1 DEAD/DEAH box helicase family protein [Myxococcus sp. CA033]NTX52302.1 DEAD/DEAH box helicase family protein [Myxococcus sp. CA039A]NTX63051.1 DEAD/DEAH box helicase family protein [Myxococcus sp. CA051A]